MKRKGFYIAVTAAILVFAAGCGSTEGDENSKNQVTETVSPTEAAVATATPEPTATPAPTATPVPANYMEANGIEVLGAGNHTYQGFKITGIDGNGEYIVESAECECIFEVTQEENGDGTKTIFATMHCIPTIEENGAWSTSSMGGFVDKKSGKAFLPLADKMDQSTLLKQDETNFEISVFFDYQYPSETYPYYTETYIVVCPSDYEDAGFYITGFNRDSETFSERAGVWKKLDYIRHGESDLLVFGVKEGLATVPEEVPAEEVQSSEHCFEKYGLTMRDAGKFTYTGTVVTQKQDTQTGTTEITSIEIKEVEAEFSVTEELPGNGTKIIRGTFTVIPEMISENEVKMVSSLNGVINKRTGESFGKSANGLAIPYEIEWKGNKTTLLVAKKVSYSSDEVPAISVTHTVVCPEDYDELAFCWTGKHTEEEPEYEPEYEPENDLDLLLFYGKHFGFDVLFFE